jgi:hypothetical protein
MKVRLPVSNAMQLQSILNSVDTLKNAVPDGGVYKFDKKWRAWTATERKAFLMAVRLSVEVLRVLKHVSIDIEAEIERVE